MATKIPASGRVSFTLNTGIHPLSGAMIKRTVSLGGIIPTSGVNAISAVTNGIKGLFEKPVVLVSMTEVSHIV